MAISSATELKILVKTTGEQNLRRLSSELNKVGTNTAKADLKFDKVTSSLKRLQTANVKSINNTRALSNSWKELAASVEFGSAQFKEAVAESKKLDVQLAKMQGRTRGGRLGGLARTGGAIAAAGVFGGPEGAIGAGIGGIIGGPWGAATGGAIGAQVGMTRQRIGETASYAAALSRQRKALRLVIADTKEYQQAQEFLNQTSDSLAIPQDVITRQFTALTASVKGAGFETSQAEEVFKSIAAGIRGTGGSLEDMKSAMVATSQVFSKGKVSAEELRQQLGERLPGAFTLFAKSMDKTPAELDKALEQGKVTLEDFLKFSKTLYERYGENAKLLAQGPEAAGDRLATAMSKLQVAVGVMLTPIGAQFQETFTEIVRWITKATEKLNDFYLLGEKNLGKRLLQKEGELEKTEGTISWLDEQIPEAPTAWGLGGRQTKGQLRNARAAQVAIAEELKKEIELLKTKLNLLGDIDKTTGEIVNKPKDVQKAWVSTQQVLTSIANTLANGIGNAIQGLIKGTQTLGEAFSNILRQLGEIILMAGIKNALASTSWFSFLKNEKGNVFAQNGIVPFAQGGIVDKPTIFPFANGTGLMGEAGPEAIMPLTRGADGKLGVEAIDRYRPVGSTSSGGEGEVGEGGGGSGGSGGIDVRFNTEIINDVSYVTLSQFQEGVKEAAKRGAKEGEAGALNRLRNSPSTRRKVGV